MNTRHDSKAVLKHRTPDASRNLNAQRVSRSIWSAAVHRRFRKKLSDRGLESPWHPQAGKPALQ